MGSNKSTDQFNKHIDPLMLWLSSLLIPTAISGIDERYGFNMPTSSSDSPTVMLNRLSPALGFYRLTAILKRSDSNNSSDT
jgi:hypothetical protein